MSPPTNVDTVIATARKAFQDWSQTPFNRRQQILELYASLLKENESQMAETISKEMGKPLWDSHGEVKSMIGKVAIALEAYEQRCPLRTRELPQGLSTTRHRPHGVVCVFGPFNFPGHLPNGHIVPALLAGNAVIFKPSELTPLTGELMGELWKKAGLPDGVFHVIQGGKEVGQLLALHKGINGLFFTGSWTTGKALLQQLADHPEKILALEMGGNNPLVVHQVTDLKAAVYATIQSAYLTSGQRCTCARRLIVTPGQEPFLEALVQQIQRIKVGRYTDIPEPFMGPVVSASAADKLLKAQQTLQEKGAKPLVQMRHLGDGLLTPGLLDATAVRDRPDEEYFGPLLQLIRVNDFEEALKEANRTAYGLSAGLLCPEKEYYDRFYFEVRAGVVNWNTQLTGASSAAPFGGIGHSGNHRPSAYYAADYCAYPVASLEAAALTLPSALPPGIEQS